MTENAQCLARSTVVRRRAVGGTGLGLALAVAGVSTGASGAAAADWTVEPGDTVSHIALRTSSSVRAIVRANDLDSRATIRVGQRLAIPGTTGSSTAPKKTTKPAKAKARTHTVVHGDTVSALAQRYGTSVTAIVRANGLGADALIRVGDRLRIPGTTTSTGQGSAATATASSSGTTTVRHTVRAGDTVSALATRYGTTVARIVEANALDSRAFIRVGQTLSIPGTRATVTTTSSGRTDLVGSTFAGRTYPAATVASANANKQTLLEIGVPSRAEMQDLVRSTATRMGVDPALAQAIAYQESGFNHASVSPANAIGVMQVIPASGDWASDMVGRELNLLDPEDNVVAGVAILRSLLRSAPDRSTAIAGYYQGLAGVKRNGMYPDTRRYVANVQTLMKRFA